METKFLSDGRKVVVCGKINQTEYIVQEIFVTKDGSEIPSGENFTAKSLHDVPVESWKQKEEKRIEALLDSRKKELDKIDKEIRDAKERRVCAAEWIKRNNFVKDNLPDFDWEYFADVISGNMAYAVNVGWGITIEDFSKETERFEHSYGTKKFDGIKAISLAYRYDKDTSNKKYTFCVNEYYDGSGNWRDYVFFRNLKELQEHLNIVVKEMFDSGKLVYDHLKVFEQYITVDPEIRKVLVDEKNKQVEARYNDALVSANKILEGKVE